MKDKCQADIRFNDAIATARSMFNLMLGRLPEKDRDLFRRGFAWAQSQHWRWIGLWSFAGPPSVTDLFGVPPDALSIHDSLQGMFVSHVKNYPHFLDDVEPRIYYRTE